MFRRGHPAHTRCHSRARPVLRATCTSRRAAFGRTLPSCDHPARDLVARRRCWYVGGRQRRRAGGACPRPARRVRVPAERHRPVRRGDRGAPRPRRPVRRPRLHPHVRAEGRPGAAGREPRAAARPVAGPGPVHPRHRPVRHDAPHADGVGAVVPERARRRGAPARPGRVRPRRAPVPDGDRRRAHRPRRRAPPARAPLRPPAPGRKRERAGVPRGPAPALAVAGDARLDRRGRRQHAAGAGAGRRRRPRHAGRAGAHRAPAAGAVVADVQPGAAPGRQARPAPVRRVAGAVRARRPLGPVPPRRRLREPGRRLLREGRRRRQRRRRPVAGPRAVPGDGAAVARPGPAPVRPGPHRRRPARHVQGARRRPRVDHAVQRDHGGAGRRAPLPRDVGGGPGVHGRARRHRRLHRRLLPVHGGDRGHVRGAVRHGPGRLRPHADHAGVPGARRHRVRRGAPRPSVRRALEGDAGGRGRAPLAADDRGADAPEAHRRPARAPVRRPRRHRPARRARRLHRPVLGGRRVHRPARARRAPRPARVRPGRPAELHRADGAGVRGAEQPPEDRPRADRARRRRRPARLPWAHGAVVLPGGDGRGGHGPGLRRRPPGLPGQATRPAAARGRRPRPRRPVHRPALVRPRRPVLGAGAQRRRRVRQAVAGRMTHTPH